MTLDMVRFLEGRENRERGKRVLAALREIPEPKPVVQNFSLPPIYNVIVDLGPQPRFLFSVPYDAYPMLLHLSQEWMGRGLEPGAVPASGC